MKFTFTEKKMDASEELRAYAEKKIGKIDRLFKTESEAFVTFSTERGRFRAEVTIKNNGMFYRVSELTGDMYASIDSAVASIERQIRKNKTRLERAKKVRQFELADEFELSEAHEEEPDEEIEIAKHKTFFVKTMTVEEAILQMNLLGHTFFLFRDDGSGEVNVVYKRNDGKYGVLEPET